MTNPGNFYINGGKISRYGTIRILSKVVNQQFADPTAGAEEWCRSLVRYGDGAHTANFVGDEVHVTNASNKLVARVSVSEMIPLDSHDVEYVVLENGYLHWTNAEQFRENRQIALDAADRGETPKYLDDSYYAKVSRDFAGQTVIRLQRRGRTFAVLSPEMQEIEFTEDTPLAFKRWDKKVKTETDFASRFEFVHKFDRCE